MAMFRELLDKAVGYLRDDFDLEVEVLPMDRKEPQEFDAGLRLRLSDGRPVLVDVQMKPRLRPSTIPLLRGPGLQPDALAGQRYSLILAPYVSEPMADRLREAGLWFIDAVGNAHIEILGTMFIYRVGRRPTPQRQVGAHWMGEHGARVLFQLLQAGPRIEASYRDLAARAGVSLGFVSKLMNELTGHALLVPRERSIYDHAAPQRLLDMWSDAFAAKLQPRLELGRYKAATGNDFAALLNARGAGSVVEDVIVGGEYAADLMTSYLRAGSLSLFVSEDLAGTVQRALRLAPSGDGNIVLYRAFANTLGRAANEQGIRLADPLLVYAELIATDDPRCGETAQRLKELELKWIES